MDLFLVEQLVGDRSLAVEADMRRRRVRVLELGGGAGGEVGVVPGGVVALDGHRIITGRRLKRQLKKKELVSKS